VTNTLINARKAVDKSSAGEVENVPILSTSVAYGVYMAVSSNLRYNDPPDMVFAQFSKNMFGNAVQTAFPENFNFFFFAKI
jgi:hypothetical protein